MRKVLLAGVLAAAALAALPERSHAWGRDPYNGHGMTWLEQFTYRTGAWIHHDGPLYSYGPYNLPGYVNMHIPQPHHGAYSPADPNLWNGGYGNYRSVLPAPAAGYPPHAVPSLGPPQPYISGVQPMSPGERVVPVSYDGVSPRWMLNR
jgi:hypothetical protein